MPVMERYDTSKLLPASASQYLPPDYLQPLPTTLDAKNSPLALLAQTCSSIGKDPPSKPIIPPLERKDSSQKSGGMDNKGSPPKERDGRTSNDSHRSNSSTSKDIPNFYPISTSSPKPEKSQADNQRTKDGRKSADSVYKSPTASSRPLSNSSSSGLNGLKSNIDRASPRPKTSDQTKDNRDSKCSPPPPKRQRSESPVRRDTSPGQEGKYSHPLYPGLPYGAMGYPGLPYGPSSLQPSAEALAAAGYPYGLPGGSSYSLASAHALAAHQAALKSSSSAALSQYMQYASRLRAPGGVSACKDPYCTNCVASGVPQNSHISQCTSPGCAQCSHEKALQGLFGLQGSNPLHSPLGVPSSSAFGLSHLHSLYAQNLLSQQGQQHVCNWMAGSEYCGKRFNSSEELLQHLRTHTAGGESALSAYGSLGLSIPTPGDLPGLPGYPGAGSSISPETLRRMYPTSLSPLGGSSLSSRYHPYKSALQGGPPGLPAPQSLSTLGPYYSPYNIYGQRIGSAAVP
ncbi:NOC-like protein [Mya arenaria]|uniref:NOC-like protein n=1 Tax=Mya arenaria TaxID=6604 RepID=A0ABY7DGY5_MYAAR|nr:zinc finger protein Noc-like [Mya arenaria]WAQ95338.1 NOC-like protein [Mya arenaria]